MNEIVGFVLVELIMKRNWKRRTAKGYILEGLAVPMFYSWSLVTAPSRPEKDDSPKYTNRSGAP
jgi:hypothetical protein